MLNVHLNIYSKLLNFFITSKSQFNFDPDEFNRVHIPSKLHKKRLTIIDVVFALRRETQSSLGCV